VGNPRVGERLFKITLAVTDANAKDNEELIQNAGTVNGSVWGGGGRPPWAPSGSRPRGGGVTPYDKGYYEKTTNYNLGCNRVATH
jgi:hypothetical protein